VKGCQGSNQYVLAPSFFLKVVSFAMMVSIGLGYYFGGKSFRRLGSWTINIGFYTGEGLLGSFARVLHSEVLCAHHTVRLVPKFSRHLPVNTKTGISSSDSMSLSTSSSSESTKSERSRGRQFDKEGTSYGGMTSGIPMETVREVREDPPEELAESDWPAKGGYGWAAADVRNQSSLFRWSRLLNSCLNYTPVISKGVSGDIVSLERVSAIDRVCHGQEGATEKFFYMYMCHFSQLHVRLPLDGFTMGVLRALNVAPMQLHPNSWAYL